MISLWARLKRKSLSKKKLCKTYSQNKSLKQQVVGQESMRKQKGLQEI